MAYQRKNIGRIDARIKQISVRITQSQYDMVQVFCDKRGITMAILLDLALQHYMKGAK